MENTMCGRCAMALIGLLAMFVVPAQAAEWSLLLNGKAVHLETPAGVKFNEENWGAGVQVDFGQADSKWRPFLTASGFKDSFNKPSYYAGGGTLRRFEFGTESSAWHLDAGAVLFLMTRHDHMNNQPFPGILPVLSVGSGRVALNMSYVPKIDPKMVSLIFFQIKIGVF